MSITASEIVRSVSLGGGNTFVLERHTASDGTTYDWQYTADSTVDTSAKLAIHATQLAAQLAEAEADEVLQG